MLDAWRRQHFVPMPDETVPLCNFTLLMYSADTLEKWDLLNLRHRSIVQHAVLKQDYAGSDSRNMTRTEEKVKEVHCLTILADQGAVLCQDCLLDCRPCKSIVSCKTAALLDQRVKQKTS